MTRLYIAGPMSGRPDLNFPAFEAAAEKLRAAGFEVASPAEFIPDQSTPWAECMRRDIPELLRCDAVALLPEWQLSRGALLEAHIADQLGMRRALVSVWLDDAVREAA